MKKILSIVLAVAMLSTVAFADDYASGLTHLDPGGTLALKSSDFTGLGVINGDFISDNFNVSAKKFSKGSNLVKSVAFNNDDEKLEIKFNQDYGMTVPNANNFVIEKIEIKSKKEFTNSGVKIPRNATYAFSGNGTAAIKVGYDVVTIPLTSGSVNYSTSGVVKFDGPGSAAYGDASLSGPDFYMSGRAYKGDKIFTKVDGKVGDDQKAILKEYPDSDLRFINFVTSGLSSNHILEIAANEDEFVYEIVDGKISKSNLKWDEDSYAWVGKIRTSKNFVISDVELKAVASVDDSTSNPSTGANDVVGIAAALAVVSLVAAGAVSMKK